jgi:Cu(I)/Ag(I) efflux system membrane fusion protein
MAFDNKGASWLQKDEDIRNPYFGAAMYKCGEVTRQLKDK